MTMLILQNVIKFEYVCDVLTREGQNAYHIQFIIHTFNFSMGKWVYLCRKNVEYFSSSESHSECIH